MKRTLLAITMTVVTAFPATAQDMSAITVDVVNNHILPRYDNFADTAQVLAQTAQTDCDAASPDLRAAYGDAFDAWVAVSHMRFGPSEVDDRAFALAFWPDSRGVTPKSLAGLIASEDPIAANAEAYRDMSIAARGFYALEFLLYDEVISSTGSDTYRCQLVQTVTEDIAGLTVAIDAEWNADYADRLLHPSDGSTYRSDAESVQELYKALSTGLEFLEDTRLGRPLGTFDRPRPTRAEARRSSRSQHHVAVQLASLRDLALRLASGDAALTAKLTDWFDRAQGREASLDDPVFAGVSDPLNRFKIEMLQQSVGNIRTVVTNDLGPYLGVAAGFNALDGD